MSRKVPFKCTEQGYVGEMLKGAKGGTIAAISPTCQIHQLCPKDTPRCKGKRDPLLFDQFYQIANELASAKVTPYPVVRDERGKITRGKIRKNEHQQMEI